MKQLEIGQRIEVFKGRNGNWLVFNQQGYGICHQYIFTHVATLVIKQLKNIG